MTVVFAEPTKKEYAALAEARPEACKKDPKLADNYLYHQVFGIEEGFYAAKKRPANIWSRTKDGTLNRLKTHRTRREWIESYFTIQKKDGTLETLKLNPPQRRLEAQILRLERAGLPVRIIILKARQMGFSTYVQGVKFHALTRGVRVKSIIIANVDETAELLLSIATTALNEMPKTEETRWQFKMESKSAYSLVWGQPINSSLKITSAKRPHPGRGGTRQFGHLSEGAFWDNAREKAAGILKSIPTLPWTYVFHESTANGQGGYFCEEFWNSWDQREIPIKERVRLEVALFFAWFEDPGYRLSCSRKFTQDNARDIAATLDEHERMLLSLTYFRRWQPTDEWTTRPGKCGAVSCRKGVGMRKVDLDQLAWRRAELQSSTFGGNLTLFDQENPWSPESAFRASGHPVFDPERLGNLWHQARPPLWEGDISAA